MPRTYLIVLFVVCYSNVACGRYVTKSTLPPPQPDYFKEYNLQYERYLKDVVATLESDQAFVDRIRNATPEDIQSGKIAEALDFVGHGVRSKLNQIKLIEIERLRRVLEDKKTTDYNSHLEHIDPAKEAFDKKDLERLIRKTGKDMDMLDAERHQEYKRHEMDDEIKFRRRMASMTEEQRQEARRQRQEMLKKRKEAKMKHPGSKGQLQDVWEQVDDLPKEAFDMKTFFRLHDTNSDGYLDVLELEALFQKELDKVYDPKTDAVEREEELVRMRRHVVEEMDKNGDGLISFDEFVGEQQSPDFENNSDWDPLDPTDAFSESELRSYEREWEKEHPQIIEPTVKPTVEPVSLDSQIQVDIARMQHNAAGQPVPQPPAYPNDNMAHPQTGVNVQTPQPVMQQQQQNMHGQQPPVAQFQQPGVQYQQAAVPQQNIQYQQQVPPNTLHQGMAQQAVPVQAYQQQYVPQQGGVPVQQNYQPQMNVPQPQAVPVQYEQQQQQPNAPPNVQMNQVPPVQPQVMH